MIANILRKTPLINHLYRKNKACHAEAFNTLLISWIIINIPILLKYLNNINELGYKGAIVFPYNVQDIIVYSISFLAPFVFCYKNKDENLAFFRSEKDDACWGLCCLIVIVSLLSFYFIIDKSSLNTFSLIVLGLLYISSLFLWYFSIIVAVKDKNAPEIANQLAEEIEKEKDDFASSFNKHINKSSQENRQ